MVTPRQSVLGLAALLGCLAGAAAAQPAPSPCRVIRLACLKSGFQPGSGPSDVERACVRPVVYGGKPPKGETLPTVDPKIVAECRANLERARPAAAPAPSSTSKAPATPSNTEEPTTTTAREPTAVAPHNPPPTDPGPNSRYDSSR
jgi:hypothetical protein